MMAVRISALLAALSVMTVVTLSDDAWIDVIQNGRYARSIGSTARGDCPCVRKSVRLDLDASPVVLQLSGVAPDTIAVTIGAVE